MSMHPQWMKNQVPCLQDKVVQLTPVFATVFLFLEAITILLWTLVIILI